MGRARLRSPDDFPSGAEDGTGTLTAADREFAFQFVQVGNPQCAIEVADGLEELDLPRYGAPIERHELFPNRTNVSFWRRTGDAAIRARIFERGVGETMSSGTGATGAAVAAVLRGVDSPVTVAPRRRRARGRGGGGPARGPDRLGQARLPRHGERRADGGAACNRVSASTACPRTCSPSSSARSREKKAAGVDVISLGIGDPDTPDARRR